jgi:histone-lysine N-methyltransferase ASH1L
MDVSIMDAQMVTMKHVPKGRARRVTPRLTKDDGLVARVETESLKSRTISGETLVNIDNASQSTLVKEGIAALDLPWNMSQVFSKEGKTDLLDRSHNKSTDTVPYTKTAEEEEEDRLREEKAAAKRAKMAENNKIWEERRKAAEKQASRRSSRVPILDKAGDLVTNIANSVLGKRKERAPEPRTSPRKSLGTFPSAFPSEPVLPEPSLKKRRVTQGDAPLFAEPIQPKAPGRRGEKKWLSAGLYVGQLRPLTGNKNRRKSAAALEEVRENKVLPLPMYAGERLLTQGRDFKLPFDVFCPLPNGQPKPDEWKKVNKNVFVGDAAQSWRVSKYEEHSSCVCKPETGCDQDCMNRYMFYECDDRNCNLTAEQCGNRPFEALRQRVKKGGKYNVGVEVIKTEDRGYGVRSNRTFEPNQLIVEYTGEIITQEECERRMKTIYKTNEVWPPFQGKDRWLTRDSVTISCCLIRT